MRNKSLFANAVMGITVSCALVLGGCSSNNDGSVRGSGQAVGTDGNGGNQSNGSPTGQTTPPSDTGSPGAQDGGTAGAADATAPSVGPTLAELQSKFFTAPLPENRRVICPFLKMLETTGVFYPDAQALANRLTSAVAVPIAKLVDVATQFGCIGVCEPVIDQVAALQHANIPGNVSGTIELANLPAARPIAHDCGFTFGFGEKQASDTRRDQTLSRLHAIADAKSGTSQGTLVWKDLYDVRIQTCEDENVAITKPSQIEVDLIYAFLGGPDRGYIQASDVDLFFHGQLPQTKIVGFIDAPTMGKIQTDTAPLRIINAVTPAPSH